MIPYGRQDINQADIDAVLEVLQSDYLTQGPKVPLFEELVAQKVAAKFAYALNSATSALHVACMALGLGKGDYLWTSPITFVASANCGLYCGADIDFVDIDPKSHNLSIESLEAKLLKAELEKKLPKVLVVVHMSGQSADMQAVKALSERFNFKVIEDASHAIGGKYLGKYIGGCQYSDITVFSFHPVKIITTAEGGLVLTNDATLAESMNLLRSHGVTRDEGLMTEDSHGPWYYQQIELGYNYRMTELQAALGISQLERLDEYVAKRHALAKRYDEKLKDLPITTPEQHPYSYSSRHLYVIRLQLNNIQRSHRQVFDELRHRGIGVNLHYIPVHIQPYYIRLGFDSEDFPEAMRYYQEAISLPLYQGLTNEEQDQVIAALKYSLGLGQ